MSKLGTVDDLVNDVTRSIKLAYARGFQAGGLKMRENILSAADDLKAPTHDEIAASIRHYGQRSAWGCRGRGNVGHPCEGAEPYGS
jgi:hypothetical protein